MSFYCQVKDGRVGQDHLQGPVLSILIDGTTDKGNIDDELLLVVWCDTDSDDEKVHTRMSFFAVARPKAVMGKDSLSVYRVIWNGSVSHQSMKNYAKSLLVSLHVPVSCLMKSPFSSHLSHRVSRLQSSVASSVESPGLFICHVGTNGVVANIASAGLQGLVRKELDWIFFMWCLVELSVKDVLEGTHFDLIDEMLLHLYYLYEKSPKKCQHWRR